MAEKNWVERKAVQEKQLRAHAPDIWRDACAAVQSACESFTALSQDHENAEVERSNGHYLKVIVHSRNPSGNIEVYRIDCQFDSTKFKITTTRDSQNARHFFIKSDQDRCFIQYGSEAVTPDRFSEIVLFAALYGHGADALAG